MDQRRGRGRRRREMLSVQARPMKRACSPSPLVRYEDDELRKMMGMAKRKVWMAGAHSKKGPLHPNEDRFSWVVEGLEPELAFFAGVYDGHGGSLAASFVKNELHHITNRKAKAADDSLPNEWLIDSFEETHQKFSEKHAESDSGACVAALIGIGGLLVGASAGDCGIIVAHLDGDRSYSLVRRFKASDDDEAARIRAAGGVVQNGRINGLLEPSRGIGDLDVIRSSPPGVLISTPDIGYFAVPPNERWFALVASDGVWDAMPEIDVIQFVREHLHSSLKSSVKNRSAAIQVAKALAEHCVPLTSDDVTAIIICL